MRKLAFVVAIVSTFASCYKAPIEPLRLEGNLLTVDNQTADDWTNVEVWINRQFRQVTKSVPAHSRFQAPLDTFVEGFGQRFDLKRIPVKDVRLKAKLPGGKPLEIVMPFERSGLAGLKIGQKQ
jgi:hypothetical protein